MNDEREKQSNLKLDLIKAIDNVEKVDIELKQENVKLPMFDDENFDRKNEPILIGEKVNFNKFFEDSIIITDKDYQENMVLNQEIDDSPEEIVGKKEDRENIKLKLKIKNLHEAEDPRIFRKKRFERELMEQNCRDQKELENARLVYDTAKLHPRKADSRGKLIKYSACFTKTGFFCCKKTSLDIELNQFGAANLIYFRSLKALIITLLIISILQGVLIYSYFNSTKSMNSMNLLTTALISSSSSQTFDLINFVNQFSLANRPSHLQMCEKYSLKEIYKNNTGYSPVESIINIINLSCPLNHTVYPSFFGLSKLQNLEAKNNENCVKYSFNQNINIDSSCDLTTWFYNQFYNQCVVKDAKLNSGNAPSKYIFYSQDTIDSKQTPFISRSNQCKISIDKASLPSCVYDQNVNSYLYLTFTCNINYQFSIFSSNFFDENFDFIQSGIDTVSLISLLICIIIIYYQSSFSEEISREKFPSIDDFSIRIKNLNFYHKTFAEDLNKLIYHVIRVLKLTEKNKDADSRSKNMLIFTSHSPIYEVNYPIFNYTLLSDVIKKEEMNQKLENLVLQYEQARNRGELYIEQYESEIKVLKNRIAVQNNKIRFSDYNYNNQNIQNNSSFSEDKLEFVDDIYFTFKEIKHAQKISKIYDNKNLLTRSLIILFCCKQKIEHLYFKNKWLDVELHPDAPKNISWLNSSFNPLARNGRKLLNWIICVILVCLSWVVVYFLREKLVLLDNLVFTNIDCSKIDYRNLIPSDYLIFRNNSKLFCFCWDIYLFQGSEFTLNFMYDNSYPCRNWIKAKNNLNFMTYTVVLAIPLLNFISRIIISYTVAIFENAKSKIEEKLSIFYKIFCVIFLNSSFSFIVFNSFIKESWVENTYYPFFNGLYKDFGTAWYKNLGSVIILMSVVNIFEPHLEGIIKYFFYCLRRMLDSGNMNGERSKLRIKKKFMDLYLSPEFNVESRYASILAYLCSNLIFSSALPLIYPIMMISLLISYWIDKTLFLKFYRNNNLQKSTLSNHFVGIFLIFICLHCLFGVWINGTGRSLYNANLSELLVEKSLTISNLPLLALFVLISLFFFLKLTLSEFIVFLLSCLNDESTKSKPKYSDLLALIPITERDDKTFKQLKQAEMREIQQRIKDMNRSNRIIPRDPLLELDNNLINEIGKELEIEKSNPIIENKIPEKYNIYETLSLASIYKNYCVRKFFYVKINKLSLFHDVRFVIDMLRKNIDNDRTCILIKLAYLTGEELEIQKIENFDTWAKGIMSKYVDEEESLIKSEEKSYSLAYDPLFESILYQELIKE